jgi:hypothetical protein
MHYAASRLFRQVHSTFQRCQLFLIQDLLSASPMTSQPREGPSLRMREPVTVIAKVPIYGYGNVDLHVTWLNGNKGALGLKDVAICADFNTNLVLSLNLVLQELGQQKFL